MEDFYSDAVVGESSEVGYSADLIRITAEGCVALTCMRKLLNKPVVERDVFVHSKQAVVTKSFTRLKLKEQYLLADRITGTLYDEASGRCSSPDLYLIPLEPKHEVQRRPVRTRKKGVPNT